MKPLPPKGLIVSCYLESMKGCEKQFIASVAHLPHVVALRIEGLDNIRFARMIAPEKYIIGLVKRISGALNHVYDITPRVEDGVDIINAGADMVATDNMEEFFKFSSGAHFPFPIMLDMGKRQPPTVDFTKHMTDTGWEEFIQCLKSKKIVIATTHMPKAFKFVSTLHERFPFSVINLEGGIETREEVEKGFSLGANYVTIGRQINDPPTIIKSLVG